MNRQAMLARVNDRSTPWDIVVIGGGATGVGVAVDAATRGFDVLLLERRILARPPPAAAPSWSTAASATWSKATSRWSWKP